MISCAHDRVAALARPVTIPFRRWAMRDPKSRTHLIVIGTPFIDDVTSTHCPLIFTTIVPATLPLLSDGPVTRTPTFSPESTTGSSVGVMSCQRDCAHTTTLIREERTNTTR